MSRTLASELAPPQRAIIILAVGGGASARAYGPSREVRMYWPRAGNLVGSLAAKSIQDTSSASG